MPYTIQVRTNGTQLASIPIPDNAVPQIRKIVGGTTAAQTAQAFLELLVPLLRAYMRDGVGDQARGAIITQAEGAKNVARTAFDVDWPE